MPASNVIVKKKKKKKTFDVRTSVFTIGFASNGSFDLELAMLVCEDVSARKLKTRLNYCNQGLCQDEVRF